MPARRYASLLSAFGLLAASACQTAPPAPTATTAPTSQTHPQAIARVRDVPVPTVTPIPTTPPTPQPSPTLLPFLPVSTLGDLPADIAATVHQAQNDLAAGDYPTALQLLQPLQDHLAGEQQQEVRLLFGQAQVGNQ